MSNDKFERLSDAIDGFMSVEELKTLRETEWSHGTFEEFTHAIQQSAARRLHPMRGHVYARGQWIKSERREKLQLGIKIDGLRRIAERSGEYAGQRGPFWYDQDGERHEVWLKDEHPAACVVEILRHDFETPMRGIARWDDYAPYHYNKDEGEYELAYMWDNMDAHMLAKCAEAGGHRKAFQVGDLYIEEEMHQEEVSEGDARREPADAHEETARDVEEVNQALDLGGASGDGAAEQQTPDPNDDLGIGEPSDPKQAAEKPLDPEAATGGDRTPGSAMSDEEQSEAKQAAQERAQQNGAPERTISTGDGSQLNLLFAKGVHGGPFTKDALKRMVRREFGYDELDAIQAQDFDRVLEHAQDEALASKYIGDPDTKDLFGGEEEEGEEEGLDLSGWDVSETEEQQLRDAYEKVDRTLASTDVLEERVVHANGFLHAVEGEPEARRSAVEQAVEARGVAPVPQDFPHRERLIAAGLYTLQTIHDNLRNDALTAIDGIGEKREAEIEQQIGHYDFDPLPVAEPTGEPEGPPNDEAFADDPAEDEAVPL